MSSETILLLLLLASLQATEAIHKLSVFYKSDSSLIVKPHLFPCPKVGRYGELCDKKGILTPSQHCSIDTNGEINGHFHRRSGKLLRCIHHCSYGGYTGQKCSVIGTLKNTTACGYRSDVIFTSTGQLKDCRSCTNGYGGSRCSYKTKEIPNCAIVSNPSTRKKQDNAIQTCLQPIYQNRYLLSSNSTTNTTLCSQRNNATNCPLKNGTGPSTCQSGYYGYGCQLNTVVRRHCKKVSNTGFAFRFGYRYQTCTDCDPGYMGTYCGQSTYAGSGRCYSGYHGYRCQLKTKARPNCKIVSNKWNRLEFRYGYAYQVCYSCTAGYSGIYCQTGPRTCRPGYYGYGCQLRTRVRQNCKTVSNTGSAYRYGYNYQTCSSCKHGYGGTDCIGPGTCRPGYYGYGCQLRTRIRTNCITVINTGYAYRYGYNSQLCSSCKLGYRGSYCQTGPSTCRPGYYGYGCQLRTRVRQNCKIVSNTGSAYRYGYNYQTCRSCKNGYTGTYCQTLRWFDTPSTCKSGYYGYRCQLRTRIRTNCITVVNTGDAYRYGYNFQSCSSCKLGYGGTYCQTGPGTCRSGYHGYGCQLRTRIRPNCKTVSNTGNAYQYGYNYQTCRSCKNGYSGTFCQIFHRIGPTSCQSGNFGLRCQFKTKIRPFCRTVSNSGDAFKFGYAYQTNCTSCFNGYSGSTCQLTSRSGPDSCLSGYFGYLCQLRTTIHKVCKTVTNTGNSFKYGYKYQSCTSCNTGYSGSSCLQSSGNSESSGGTNSCLTGYYGHQCKLRTKVQPYCKTVSNEGSAFKYGYSYQTECSSCYTGYSGSFCTNTTQSGPNTCQSGYFGYLCQLKTPIHNNCKTVLNTGNAFRFGYSYQTCHTCASGYSGSKCVSNKLPLSEFWIESKTSNIIRLIQNEDGINISFVEVIPKHWKKASGYVMKVHNTTILMNVIFENVTLVGTLNGTYRQIFWSNSEIWEAKSIESVLPTVAGGGDKVRPTCFLVFSFQLLLVFLANDFH